MSNLCLMSNVICDSIPFEHQMTLQDKGSDITMRHKEQWLRVTPFIFTSLWSLLMKTEVKFPCKQLKEQLEKVCKAWSRTSMTSASLEWQRHNLTVPAAAFWKPQDHVMQSFYYSCVIKRAFFARINKCIGESMGISQKYIPIYDQKHLL